MFDKRNSSGFVLAEFAIALPLLILLGVGLANVGIKIFQLGKIQLADYVLEAEAQYVMERITRQARAAKEINVTHLTADIDQLSIAYHTARDEKDGLNYVQRFNDGEETYYKFWIFDVRETQFFIPRPDTEKEAFVALNAKRVDDGLLRNPITGGNFFGKTKINRLKYNVDEGKKILHITLEMENFDSGHKIKFVTAVFMPGLESVSVF